VDEQIKLRGFRIEPGEIEAALLESPAIERAAVVARSIGPGGATPDATQLVAFVQTHDNDPIENWRQTLARRLPGYMVPSRLVTLAELPRLPNGKVNRRHLQDLVLDPGIRGGEPARIPSTGEQALISLWEGLLGRTGIGPSDNFFELGGHSLLVVEMTRAIERDLEASLPVTDVFEHPTVEELARHIEKRGGSEAPPYQHLFPIQPAGRKMPFIVAVPHFFTQMFAARFRGERPVYGLRGVSLRPQGNRGRWRTMTDLGEELVEEIVRRFPDQSCIMAGYSFGASMAVEAVRVMEERGVPVHRLYLIAPMAVDFYGFGPFRVQIDGLRKPVNRLSASEALSLFLRCNHPLTHRPYSRAWRRIGIESWRRMLCGVGQLRKWIGLPLTSRILHADVRVERFRLHGQYRPGVVHTPTFIFNAEDTKTDAAATWRPYFEGPFTVHPTPDPHDAASVEAARKVILRHLDDLGDS
jgi:acyl carrier protein